MTKHLVIQRPEHPLEAATALFGTGANLARKIGYTPAAIYNWRSRGRVPRRAAVAIEVATAGQVTAEEILAANVEA